MRHETIYRKRESAISGLRDAFSSAVSFGSTHETLLNNVHAARAKLVGCPQRVFSYFDGYQAALQEDLYRKHLMFGGMIGDSFYSTHSDRADYYGKNGIEPSAYADDGLVSARGHYWKAFNGKRAFFISTIVR